MSIRQQLKHPTGQSPNKLEEDGASKAPSSLLGLALGYSSSYYSSVVADMPALKCSGGDVISCGSGGHLITDTTSSLLPSD